MQGFEHAFLRALRQIYDAEQQQITSLPAMRVEGIDLALSRLIDDMAGHAQAQTGRLREVFEVLYLTPGGDVCWPATALLRQASDQINDIEEPGHQGCAAALLSLKRYELGLYECLYCWSRQYALDEVVPGLRRSIAEEMMDAAALSQIAFGAIETEQPRAVLYH